MDNIINTIDISIKPMYTVASANTYGSYEVGGAQAKIDLGSVKTIKSIFCGVVATMLLKVGT